MRGSYIEYSLQCVTRAQENSEQRPRIIDVAPYLKLLMTVLDVYPNARNSYMNANSMRLWFFNIRQSYGCSYMCYTHVAECKRIDEVLLDMETRCGLLEGVLDDLATYRSSMLERCPWPWPSTSISNSELMAIGV